MIDFVDLLLFIRIVLRFCMTLVEAKAHDATRNVNVHFNLMRALLEDAKVRDVLLSCFCDYRSTLSTI